MASMNMHLCISKEIQDRFSFSDRYMLGCIMPDILKHKGIERDKTHYKTGILDSQIDVSQYINEKQESLRLQDELSLGYLTHLIEDKIWFSSYCVTDKMSVEEYVHKVYSFFRLADRYLLQQSQLNLETLKMTLVKQTDDILEKKIIREQVVLGEIIEPEILLDLTYHDIDQLKEECISKTSKVIENLIRK